MLESTNLMEISESVLASFTDKKPNVLKYTAGFLSGDPLDVIAAL